MQKVEDFYVRFDNFRYINTTLKSILFKSILYNINWSKKVQKLPL